MYPCSSRGSWTWGWTGSVLGAVVDPLTPVAVPVAAVEREVAAVVWVEEEDEARSPTAASSSRGSGPSELGEIVSGAPGPLGSPATNGTFLTTKSRWGGSLVGDWVRATIPAAAAPLTNVTLRAVSSPAENQLAGRRGPPPTRSPHCPHQSCSAARGAPQCGQVRPSCSRSPEKSLIPPHFRRRAAAVDPPQQGRDRLAAAARQAAAASSSG